MRFETDIFSDRGGRAVNEDSTAVSSRSGAGGTGGGGGAGGTGGGDCDFLVAVLADGVGAHGGGDIASKVVVETLSDINADRSDLSLLYESTDLAVKACQKPGLLMKSTAVMAEINGTSVRISNVGDSRCYVFRKNKIIFQTADHSFPGLDLLRGKIKASEVRFHPGRNKLLRAVGSDNCTPESNLLEVKAGDVFLLASDGFWEYINEAEMQKTLRKCRALSDFIPSMRKIMEKRFPPDHDNYSAIAVRII